MIFKYGDVLLLLYLGCFIYGQKESYVVKKEER